MWESQIDVLERGQIQKISLLSGKEPLPYSEVVALWQSDETFRAYFDGLLRDAPFEAYFWETPALTDADRPFEFVLVNSSSLAHTQADPQAFENQFASRETNEDVIAFPNFGGDAILVVPRPIGSTSAYAHLAAFVRNAPEAQKQALWKTVGAAMAKRIGAQPVWLSTAGLGVSWLHIRLDSRPKYYRYQPYKSVV